MLWDRMKMLRMDARSIADKVDMSGAPNIRYFPSGAMIALKEKQVKIIQVYMRADTTIDGSMSQTRSINGPVDNPKIKSPILHDVKHQDWWMIIS